MITFRIDKQTLDIDGKRIKFDYPISVLIFFNNIFFILFEPNSDKKMSGQFQNLWGVNTEGTILWKATFPDTLPDCFLNIYMENDNLHAYSFTGYDCMIDSSTGNIIKSEFVK